MGKINAESLFIQHGTVLLNYYFVHFKRILALFWNQIRKCIDSKPDDPQKQYNFFVLYNFAKNVSIKLRIHLQPKYIFQNKYGGCYRYSQYN